MEFKKINFSMTDGGYYEAEERRVEGSSNRGFIDYIFFFF